MSWLPREIKKKRSKALLQICSAWGRGVAQHSSALVAFSRRAPLARAASQCSVGTWAAEELRKRADTLGSRQRGEICVLAGQRISATKDKGKIQQHNRVWIEKGRRARSLQKEGSLEVRQVLPETVRDGIALHSEGAYCQPCPGAGEQSAQHWPSCPKRSRCCDSALNAEAKAFVEVRGYSEITQVTSLTGPF